MHLKEIKVGGGQSYYDLISEKGVGKNIPEHKEVSPCGGKNNFLPSVTTLKSECYCFRITASSKLTNFSWEGGEEVEEP